MENTVFNEQKVSKAYFILAVPLVLSMIVTLIYNLADTFFVAQTANTNLVAGVSLGMPVFTMLMAIGNIFGQGGASLISRLIGSKNYKGARSVSSFCFYMTILIGSIFALIMILFRNPIVMLLGATPDTYDYAMSYYIYLSIGAPIIMLSFIHTNFLRSEGMSKESMIGTVSGAVVNTILDPIFISGIGLGAAGAAIASIIGYFVSVIYCVIVVKMKSQLLSVDVHEFLIPNSHVKQIFSIGIPAAIVNVMQSVSVILMNHFLIEFGNEKIAAMGIVLKISMIALLLLTGLSFGGQPLFGYYYGARDNDRMRKLISFCAKFISGVALLVTAIIWFFSKWLIQIFMNTSSIVEEGSIMLRFQVITMAFVGMILLITILFQSTGKSKASFILSVSRQGLAFLVTLVIGYHFLGYMGIICAQAVADLLTMCLALYLFKINLYEEIYNK